MSPLPSLRLCGGWRLKDTERQQSRVARAVRAKVERAVRAKVKLAVRAKVKRAVRANVERAVRANASFFLVDKIRLGDISRRLQPALFLTTKTSLVLKANL